MTRKARIYEFVCQHGDSAGMTTEMVAQGLALARPNVSKELNTLVREGQLVKLSGRPVRYTPLTAEQPAAPASPARVHSAQTRTKRATTSTPVTTKVGATDIFDSMIGAHESLQNQVEQAKAAILYPPRGLNTLVIGPTGSGKTYFANTMYEFAETQGVLTNPQGLITFNCADYAHNPELLMSHLFGYIKGSFTGANEDKDGLIQEADGGMLFLDEVHRLPPEGQEMIFYFMDHGTYSRLGETAKNHHANVRLVCATTEDPKSSLLQTFVRRIPITIQLPAFNQRSAKERLALLKALLSLEAARINKQIRLTEDVVQALLGSVTYGNVGQLKSNIQLVCAQGFVNSIENDTEITITMDDLPQNIRSGLMTVASNRHELGAISELLDPVLVVKPNDGPTPLRNKNDNYELPYNLYEIIGDKASLLRREGLDKEHINRFITTDINLHLKSFYKQTQMNISPENKLAEIVDQDVIDFTKTAQETIQQLLGYNFKDNFIYAVSLHISSFIKRIQAGKPMRQMSADMLAMVKEYPAEIKAAQVLKQSLDERYHLPIPESEVYYLAILLISLKSMQLDGKVGVFVAAHGMSTASSMAQVVGQLLDDYDAAAFDMPLDMDPEVAYTHIKEQIQKLDAGNGVLMLVDMGSLTTFGKRIQKETGIAIRTIDMVTTPVVLEAVRKSGLIDSDLETIYRELVGFKGYSRISRNLPTETTPAIPVPTETAGKPDANHRAIIAICATGVGTAERIKTILDSLLAQNFIEGITVFPISVVDMPNRLAQISRSYQIIAATGIAKPKLDVPFISLEELLQGGGEKFIDQLAMGLNAPQSKLTDLRELTPELCEKYLGDYFTFLNPKKLTTILWQYSEKINQTLDEPMTNAFRIDLIMHLAGALERTAIKDQITAPTEELPTMASSKWYPVVQAADQQLTDQLQLTFSEAENYYIVQLLENHQAKLA
ncbi:sigma 54-interacting transcriptional regulator [Lactiplantibacillus sp. WILCCON 0030]|uniref:Sigma 54-interacting transcriptional regulator n=1 Tax=Lactiplantibacillus brownii TaxID=3069269 RepID=A0ABU1A6A9_9LACO|nr:sigma 54-interacting transcriptional regulator [Lactiplantibacillus brownii]MDQ7936492.1 sigma 54-interacting transcriptional regulator [Lactiplantibacillus brownii]